MEVGCGEATGEQAGRDEASRMQQGGWGAGRKGRGEGAEEGL
jgi:hypothetical protein